VFRPAEPSSLRLLAAGGEAVIPPGRQRSHLAVLPNEPEIDIADIVRRMVEAALLQNSLTDPAWRSGNGGNEPGRSSRSQVHCCLAREVPRSTIDPARHFARGGVPTVSPGRLDRAGDPAPIVNAVAPAHRSV